jgi:hypothetical protein
VLHKAIMVQTIDNDLSTGQDRSFQAEETRAVTATRIRFPLEGVGGLGRRGVAPKHHGGKQRTKKPQVDDLESAELASCVSLPGPQQGGAGEGV